MIAFPVFESITVSDFGLYPGNEETAGLHVDFSPGLTFFLGANGLGKTTLVTIIYRMLTGPWDIPGLTNRPELGTVSLEPKALSSSARKIFARRVADGARQASATLRFQLGEHDILIERSLKDISLTRFEVDGIEQPCEEEDSFHIKISELAGLWSFGDWILLLRHLTFYFEDRRALIWDPTAQRQILRFLFLHLDVARKWNHDEREILELDSRVRNLSAALFKEEQALADNEEKAEVGADVREELKALEELQKIDWLKRQQLDDDVVSSEARRQQARLSLLKAEQDREAAYRELERAKLVAIEARFPDRSQTARYILAQLLSENECLVCGSPAAQAASDLEQRIHEGHCVVCDTDLKENAATAVVPASDVADKRVEKLTDALSKHDQRLATARDELEAAESAFEELFTGIAEIDAKTAQRSSRIDFLVRRLPPKEAELHQQRAELASMRSRAEALKLDLVHKRRAFFKYVENANRSIVESSSAIKEAFDELAQGFLLETCRLVWSPHKDRVGQGGESVEFPSFELEMTGSNFASPVRRSGPEQVSESQREFIDLAFRMALMRVSGFQGVGSLVIDAPESSLDAVFVKRAAQVLSRFANPTLDNRLIITSNLVEGRLIPTLLKLASSTDDQVDRLIDLFDIAEPTAAVRELAAEYAEVKAELFGNG